MRAKKIPDLSAETYELLRRGEAGDQSVVPELRKALEDHPEIWQVYGDLALQAQSAWLNMIAGSNQLMHETVLRKLEEIEETLLEEGRSPLETLLVQRIGACWLQTQYSDITYAQARNPTTAESASLMKRQTGAQHRLLQAVKTLATVRKLVKPVLSPMQVATRMIEKEHASLRRARDRMPVCIEN